MLMPISIGLKDGRYPQCPPFVPERSDYSRSRIMYVCRRTSWLSADCRAYAEKKTLMSTQLFQIMDERSSHTMRRWYLNERLETLIDEMSNTRFYTVVDSIGIIIRY